MNQQKLLNSAEFLKLLAQKDQSLGHTTMVVQGDVHINGEEIDLDSKGGNAPIQSLSLENITFNGMVHIRGFKNLSLHPSSSNFLGGLWIERCQGGHIGFTECNASSINFHSNRFKVLSLKSTEITHSLELHGLRLTEAIKLEKMKVPRVYLMSPHTNERIRVPLAKTDDPVLAFQFRMLNIPVVVSTEMAEQILGTTIGQQLLKAG